MAIRILSVKTSELTARLPRSLASCREILSFRFPKSSGFRTTMSFLSGHAGICRWARIIRRLPQDSPKTNQTLVSASVRPLLHALTGVQLRQQVWGMLAAVILVLLIACVNVMNMQFGRITLRAKEVAIRGALGATHWRIVRQMLTESLVVASLGTIAGVAIAYWAVDMFVQATNALPFPLPYWIQFKIDGPVFAFTVGVTLLATIVSGLVPAWLSAHGNAAEIMKEGGRGNT